MSGARVAVYTPPFCTCERAQGECRSRLAAYLWAYRRSCRAARLSDAVRRASQVEQLDLFAAPLPSLTDAHRAWRRAFDESNALKGAFFRGCTHG